MSASSWLAYFLILWSPGGLSVIPYDKPWLLFVITGAIHVLFRIFFILLF